MAEKGPGNFLTRSFLRALKGANISGRAIFRKLWGALLVS